MAIKPEGQEEGKGRALHADKMLSHYVIQPLVNSFAFLKTDKHRKKNHNLLYNVKILLVFFKHFCGVCGERMVSL